MQVDLFVLVVVPALENLDAAVLNFINQPVFLVNFTAPPASQIPLQGLRMANSLVPVAVNIGNQCIELPERPFILGLPIQILFLGIICPYFIHYYTSIKSCFVNLSFPSSSSRLSSSKWRILASL